MIQKSLGDAQLDYAMVGRWVDHLCPGSVAHPSIGKAAPRPGRAAAGGIYHAVSLAFAVWQ